MPKRVVVKKKTPAKPPIAASGEAKPAAAKAPEPQPATAPEAAKPAAAGAKRKAGGAASPPPAKRRNAQPPKQQQQQQHQKGTVGGATAGPWSGLKVTLSDASLSYLTKVKQFETMAPVQAQAIPQLLSGRDVVVEAVTGSGKTLAFLVPAFEICQKPDVAETIRRNPRALIAAVILPTRELALQVAKEAETYAAHVLEVARLNVVVNSFIGGRSGQRDAASYESKGANVAVGTPGRLFELMVLGMEGVEMICKTIELLILDEADRLLSAGYLTQLDAILRRVPHQRRTGLFSATQTSEVKELIRVGMRNPVVVKVQVKKKGSVESATQQLQVPESLSSYYRILRPSRKLEALCAFLKSRPREKVIAYFLTCAQVEFAVKAIEAAEGDALRAAKVEVHPLHGQMPLQKRKKVFREFQQNGGGGVLLCTDVAARGLDVPDVDWVVQVDAPTDPNTYIHRSGRAARMGRKGSSLLYLSPHESDYIEFLKLQKVLLAQIEENDDGLDTDSEASESSEDEEDGNDAEAAVAAAATEGGGGTAKTLCGMPHNEKGGIRFRVRVAKRGVREKWRAQKQRRQKRGDKQEAVVVGKASDSPFIYRVRKALVADRDLNDAAVKAFVTWVRAYRDHSLRYIFKLGRVDVVDLAHAFCLLRLPAMPELSHMQAARIPMEEEFMAVNPKAITCTTEAKEAHRQERLKLKKEREAEKAEQRSERNKMREEVKQDASIGRRKKKELWSKLEMDELNDDARLLKKLRQGKITEEQYAELSGEADMELALLDPKERRKEKKRRENAKRARDDDDNDSDGGEGGADSSAESFGGGAAVAGGDDDDDDDGSASADEEFVAPPGVKLSKSGKAPAAWIEMIKRKRAGLA